MCGSEVKLMAKDWKVIAAGLNLDIPESDLEKVQTSLDSLDKAFQPLVRILPHDTEPAVMFQCRPEEKQ
jgi:hypothetical protein